MTFPLATEIGGLWSVISAILVFKETRSESFTSGIERIFGTLIGCIIGAIYLYICQDIRFLAIAIWVTSLICLNIRRIETYNLAATIACVVVIVVWKLSHETPIWLYSLSRFVESFVGVVVAHLIVMLPPRKA